MQKITTHLWFDTQAREAADFYTAAFPGSVISDVATLHDTPSGSVDVVTIDLAGQEFQLISAGPLFRFTPTISFLVACETAEEVEALWQALSPGGKPMMELAAYPFSDRYGSIEDRYGLSWQLMLARPEHAFKRKITPTLMFTGNVAGKAEEAIAFYVSVFRDAGLQSVNRYGAGEAPDREGTLKHARFRLEGLEFAAMDSAYDHGFSFNEAISLVVHCEDQKEIDYNWARLSADPTAEQCGWLKDRFGVSWQIVPTAMERMLSTGTADQIANVTKAFLQMKKFDIATLERVFGDDARRP